MADNCYPHNRLNVQTSLTDCQNLPVRCCRPFLRVFVETMLIGQMRPSHYQNYAQTWPKEILHEVMAHEVMWQVCLPGDAIAS